MESKFIPVRGNPSSPTKNTNYPFWVIGIFLCAEDGVEVYPPKEEIHLPPPKIPIVLLDGRYFSFPGRCTNARQMHGAEKNLDRLRQHREEKPHMIRPPTVWAGFCCSAPSRSRCAQARGQLPPRQAAHERVKAIGAHRQPAVRARPQVRIFPRRQRRKTHLASPHPHSSLPAAKLLCIWITFALSLYSLE